MSKSRRLFVILFGALAALAVGACSGPRVREQEQKPNFNGTQSYATPSKTVQTGDPNKKGPNEIGQMSP